VYTELCFPHRGENRFSKSKSGVGPTRRKRHISHMNR
jgi:hypothetical protein